MEASKRRKNIYIYIYINIVTFDTGNEEIYLFELGKKMEVKSQTS